MQRILERGWLEDYYTGFNLYGGIEGFREIIKEIPVSYTHLDVYKRQSGDNGRYGNRLNAFLSTKYVNAAWGIPKYTWELSLIHISKVTRLNIFL